MTTNRPGLPSGLFGYMPTGRTEHRYRKSRANADLSAAWIFPETFRRKWGSRDMKTFLIVLLALVGAVVAVKLLPLALVPVILVLGLLLLIGGLLVGGAAAAVAAVLALLVGLLAGGLALVVVLAPIWIPVLAVVGLIALIKRVNAKSA
jgi:hypothetical protein